LDQHKQYYLGMLRKLLPSILLLLLGMVTVPAPAQALANSKDARRGSVPHVSCSYGYSLNAYGYCSKNYLYTPPTFAPYKEPTYKYTPPTFAPYKAPTYKYTPPTFAPYKAPSFSSNSATALCNDGTYSYSKNRSGTCSWHGGVWLWLK
jgi:hypothetical protein